MSIDESRIGPSELNETRRHCGVLIRNTFLFKRLGLPGEHFYDKAVYQALHGRISRSARSNLLLPSKETRCHAQLLTEIASRTQRNPISTTRSPGQASVSRSDARAPRPLDTQPPPRTTLVGPKNQR
jgi:hypothetical protein